MWELLAQNGGSDVPNWISGATAVASLGIASWFLYYTVAVRQPREDAAKAKADEDNRKHIENLMAGFNGAIREIREECRQEKNALLADLKHEREQLSKEREGREDMEKEFVRVLEERKNGDAVLTNALNKLSERIDQVARFKTRHPSGD